MNSTALKLTETTKKVTRKPATKVKKTAADRPLSSRISVPVNQLGVIDQCVIAFERKNLIATTFGFWLGGIVPFSVYMTAHFSVQANPFLWVLVIAGLMYSATTVFSWGIGAFSKPNASAFATKMKSLGFVVLLEGILTFSPEHVLSIGALLTLMTINAMATACNLIAQRKEARAEARAEAKAKKGIK